MNSPQPGTGPAPGTPPPPGWYPDPGGQPVRRWWDGTAWGDQVQPYQPPAAPAPAAPRVPARWAWTAAALGPLAAVAAVLAAAIGGPSQSTQASFLAGLIAAYVIAFAFCVKDSRAVRAAGDRPASAGAAIVFSPPVYLLIRAFHLRDKRGAWLVFAAGAVVWLTAAGVAVPLAAGVRDAASAYPACTTGTCIAREIEGSLTGGTVKDGSVMTSLRCDPATVRHNQDGSWTASCTADYSDGSAATGYGNLVPSQHQVTFEPVTVSG